MPNQLYSWDITYLPGCIKGQYFYLYVFLDIFIRKIVGWQVYAEESADNASDMMKDICQREGILPGGHPVKPFDDLLKARCRVEQVVHWYNEEYHHSQVEFVTPAQRHAGLDREILVRRIAVYTTARSVHPTRWSASYT